MKKEEFNKAFKEYRNSCTKERWGLTGIKIGRIKILACPCCGNRNLYHGHMSSDSFGIDCWTSGFGCGLQIEVRLPYDNPKHRTLKQLEKDCLKEAAKRWNRRES